MVSFQNPSKSADKRVSMLAVRGGRGGRGTFVPRGYAPVARGGYLPSRGVAYTGGRGGYVGASYAGPMTGRGVMAPAYTSRGGAAAGYGSRPPYGQQPYGGRGMQAAYPMQQAGRPYSGPSAYRGSAPSPRGGYGGQQPPYGGRGGYGGGGGYSAPPPGGGGYGPGGGGFGGAGGAYGGGGGGGYGTASYGAQPAYQAGGSSYQPPAPVCGSSVIASTHTSPGVYVVAGPDGMQLLEVPVSCAWQVLLLTGRVVSLQLTA